MITKEQKIYLGIAAVYAIIFYACLAHEISRPIVYDDEIYSQE